MTSFAYALWWMTWRKKLTQKNIGIVTRLFNGGAGRTDENGSTKPLDQKWFEGKLDALKKMLRSPLVTDLVVVNNRDKNSKFGEAGDKNGNTPTGRVLMETFADDARVSIVYVDEWGNNAGSGRAVQAGIDYLAENSNADTFMVWSPELMINPERLAQALSFMQMFNHDVVGFIRENWQNKPQWMLPQHTGFIGTRRHWALARVPLKADGDEGRTVQTEAGEVSLAGMDDLCRLLEVFKVDPDMSIGMFGISNPIAWKIDWSDERQIQKIARQWQVALAWAGDAFPDRDPQVTMDEFFKCLSIA